MDLNEYQNSLLDTLEKTKLLLEAEKERSCKLEAQLNQSKIDVISRVASLGKQSLNAVLTSPGVWRKVLQSDPAEKGVPKAV